MHCACAHEFLKGLPSYSLHDLTPNIRPVPSRLSAGKEVITVFPSGSETSVHGKPTLKLLAASRSHSSQRELWKQANEADCESVPSLAFPSIRTSRSPEAVNAPAYFAKQRDCSLPPSWVPRCSLYSRTKAFASDPTFLIHLRRTVEPRASPISPENSVSTRRWGCLGFLQFAYASLTC